MASERDRPAYRPSGHVHWLLFTLAALGLFALAVALGGAMTLLLHAGFYLIVLVPLFAAVLLAAAVALAVSMGHCRSPVAALLVGIAAGAAVFVAHFQFDLARRTDWSRLHRLDALPEFVWLRLLHDQAQGNPGVPAAARPNAVVDVVFNAAALAFSVFIVCGITGFVARARARRAYDEWLGCWTTCVWTTCRREPLPHLLQALACRDPSALGAALEKLAEPGERAAFLVFEHVPNPPDSAVFLSVCAAPATPLNLQLLAVPLLLRQVELEPSEVAEFARCLGVAGLETSSQAPPPEGAVAAPATTSPRSTPTTRAVGPLRCAAPEPRATALSQSGKRIGAALTAISVLAAMAPLLVLLALLKFAPDSVSLPMLIGMFVLFMIGVGYVCFYSSSLVNRFYYRRCLAALRERTDPAVAPDDPEAIFVEVVPRANWTRAFERADDLGFLKVDHARAILLFEGDYERWIIPGVSIRACAIEEYEARLAVDVATRRPVIIVQVIVDEAVWETAFAPRSMGWQWFSARRRRERVEELLARIQPIRTTGGDRS